MSAANERDLQPFSPRTLLALIGVGAVAFLVMAYFMIAGESGRERWPAIPSPTSRSAVGYRAFIELMRHFDLPLGSPSDGELRRASLRIVLAPASPKELHAIEASTSTATPLLIVLPKWQAFARPYIDDVASVHLMASGAVEATARAIADDVEIVRPDSLGPWQERVFKGEPTLRQPQLMRSAKLCPLVSNGEAMLIGRLCRRPSVIVLADPDVLANHGLWRGDNAVLALSLVSRLRNGSGPIVALDVVTAQPPARSIWRLAFAPPFVLIALAALVALAVAGWAAATRFGPAAAEPPDRPAGIFTLIDVAARLLRGAVDGGRLLRRYADLVTLDLGRRLHAPRRLQGAAEIGAWLDAARPARTPGLGYAALRRTVDGMARGKGTEAGGVVAAAAELHRWREELLDGR